MSLWLDDIYYRQNAEITGYKDIFLKTNLGVMQVYTTCIDFNDEMDLQSLNRLNEIDNLKKIYGRLDIQEVRRTYDNNIYILILGRFIIGIEYILNSNFENSVQDFRIIEDINASNREELDTFNRLDIIELPSIK